MKPRPWPGHERGIVFVALLGAAPALAIALAFLWTSDWTLTNRIMVSGAALAPMGLGVHTLRRKLVRALHTISSLLSSLRAGDRAVRGRVSTTADAYDLAVGEINQLADTLAKEGMTSAEASALLDKVMTEIDVAVFAFEVGDKPGPRLRLANRAAERLLGQPAGRLQGRTADELAMTSLFQGLAPRTVELTLPGGSGLWEVRRGTFRLRGLPHELLVLANLQRALREEERQAWQRLVAVLGHEINNSLAPIQSIASAMRVSVESPPDARATDWQEDLLDGLAVIERRAAGLGRFMAAYARLAKLPPPRLAPVDVTTWIGRIAALEQRLPVRVHPGPKVIIQGDIDQLDQLLINLIKNAADAALEVAGHVEIAWESRAGWLEVRVLDDGPGVASTANLFVPFFTTKPGGTGIGLVLSRQIAEAHHGTVALKSRADRAGAEACLRLPA